MKIILKINFLLSKKDLINKNLIKLNDIKFYKIRSEKDNITYIYI